MPADELSCIDYSLDSWALNMSCVTIWRTTAITDETRGLIVVDVERALFPSPYKTQLHIQNTFPIFVA